MEQPQVDVDNTNNSTVLSPSAIGAEQLPRQKLIRGSKKAVTITKREYLKTDWCKTEPFQQIIHMVGLPSLLLYPPNIN